jgi:hypothetical protein
MNILADALSRIYEKEPKESISKKNIERVVNMDEREVETKESIKANEKTEEELQNDSKDDDYLPTNSANF